MSIVCLIPIQKIAASTGPFVKCLNVLPCWTIHFHSSFCPQTYFYNKEVDIDAFNSHPAEGSEEEIMEESRDHSTPHLVLRPVQSHQKDKLKKEGEKCGEKMTIKTGKAKL